jgi:hypothetical protein
MAGSTTPPSCSSLSKVLAAFFFLWRRLRKDPRWRGHARYTLVTGVLAALLLLMPGMAYYLFLLVVLA